jgi:two-component system, NarL family, response regulator LiaR
MEVEGGPIMPQGKPIRVMLVDDHMMVRDGLKLFLSTYEDIEVVAEAGDGEEALALFPEIMPDVILMDLLMPKMDGATATARIRQINPQVQVIALTSHAEENLVQNSLRAGAIGYLLKNVHADKLSEAIRSAYLGRSTIDAEAAQVLIKAAHQSPHLGANLTSREREVLKLLVEGMTNKEIASRLVISESTARLHVSAILEKLGASNRTEATRLALQHKIV